MLLKLSASIKKKFNLTNFDIINPLDSQERNDDNLGVAGPVRFPWI